MTCQVHRTGAQVGCPRCDEDLARLGLLNDANQKLEQQLEKLEKPGYHLKEIKKGVLGQLSKVREELEEAIDAQQQGCEVMVLVELSDMIGAVRAYLERRHPHMTLGDLIVMSEITRRAFENGRR